MKHICLGFSAPLLPNSYTNNNNNIINNNNNHNGNFDGIVENILSMDAFSLSNAIRKKQVTGQQVMETTIDRIDNINSKYNAIIMLRDKDELLSLARQADDELEQQQQQQQNQEEEESFTGDDDTIQNFDTKHWLHGIPIAIKDISNVKGIPTSMGGSSLFYNFIPDYSDPYVENIMEQGGAIVIGKTNTPECGMGSHTFNTRWGITCNPFDESKSAGGSSGGAAVAISTNMLCIADGTDMMGSLRNPAGWNHIYSHRPTAGMIPGKVVPASNVLIAAKNPLPFPISTPGPMARTPLDCALLLETMVGRKETFDASTLLRQSVGLTRTDESIWIGWLAHWDKSIPFEDGILSLCHDALKDFSSKEENIIVEDVSNKNDALPLFPMNDLWNGWNNVRFAMAFATYGEQLRDANVSNNVIKDEMKWEMSEGERVSESDLQESAKIQQRYNEFLNSLFTYYDVLALPTAQLWPFPKEWNWPKSINGVSMDSYHRWMQVCIPVSFGGLPCTTIPAGFGGKEGILPMGIQLFAKRGEDEKLLRTAIRYHKFRSAVDQNKGGDDGTNST